MLTVEGLQAFLLRQWWGAPELCTVCLVFTGCLKTRKADPNKTLHPLHDFVMTMTNTFATGIVGPLLVGEIPLLFTNDLNFTVLALVWVIFYRCAVSCCILVVS